MPTGSTQEPTPVEALQHADARANIPTGELADFVADDEGAPTQVRYPRDPSLDPQLVWKDKDAQDGEDLVVPAVPIYIQEKVDPRIIVENLRRTALRSADEPELSLFDDFDGAKIADFSAKIDFYKHEANWANRMILGDSLVAMTSLAEKERMRGKVQMIYLDPPYGIKFGSNWQVSTRKPQVLDRAIDATRQPEQIRAFRDTWRLGIHSYLSYLRDRLSVSRDLLNDSGSIFVQIGDENVHLVRNLLDEVFGVENFVVQLTVQKTGSQTGSFVQDNNDYVLWYVRDRDAAEKKFNALFVQRVVGSSGGSGYKWATLPDGSDHQLSKEELKDPTLLPRGSRLWSADPLTSEGYRPTTTVDFPWQGRTFHPGSGRHWGVAPDDLAKVGVAERLVPQKTQIRFKSFFDDFPVIPLGSH